MRWVFAALALFCGLAAAYFGVLQSTSYASYSSEQLDEIEKGLLQDHRGNKLYSYDLLRDERRRRVALPVCGAGFFLLTAAAILIRPGPRSAPKMTPEDARLLAAVGPVGNGPDRQLAAQTLGVDVRAPNPVIEAAYQAQVSTLEAKKTGLAPDLARLVEERRKKLEEARDALLRKA